MKDRSGRRRFLRLIGVAAATASGAACGSEEASSSSLADATSGPSGGAMTGAGMTGAGSAGGAEPVGPDGFTYCGNVSGLPEGALIGLRFKQLVIGRDNLGVYAMTSICTHKQCNMLADGGIIPGQVICGCHDSFFDAIGAVVKGPASKPLVHFETLVDEAGEIFVQVGAIVDPSTRVAV
jgi:nitrite reductase/ring-hydroxylating ferredoxin subunit